MLKTQLSLRDYGYLKIELLAQGINYDDEFLQAYSQRDNLLEKEEHTEIVMKLSSQKRQKYHKKLFCRKILLLLSIIAPIRNGN